MGQRAWRARLFDPFHTITLLLRLHCPHNDLGDILDRHFLFSLYPLDAIVKHRDAEGAGSGQDFGSRLQCLIHTGLVDPLADALLHPGATTAAATAEALVAMTAHLRYAVAVEHRQHATRLIIDVVVAPDVTGIVVGQFTLVKAFGKFDLLISQKPVDEDGVMHHFIVASKLWILVFDRVEAVRAGGDDGAMLWCCTSYAVARGVTVM